MLTTSNPRPEGGAASNGERGSSQELRVRELAWYFVLKTGMDFVAALALLLLTAPILLIAMVLVKLTSRGPALYSQTRLGRLGKPFTIYKLRTMIHDCESLTGARWSTPGDGRITPVGRWLRKTHLDELPQLWNVLRGDMSLVGPRPERPEFVPHLEMAIPHYRERLLLRPGVTGLAQVQQPPDTNLVSVRIKLAYDLHYVQNLGFWLDVRITLGTACKMLGVPFHAIRWSLSLPSKEAVESDYNKLSAELTSHQALAVKPENVLADTEPVPAMS